MLGPSVDMRKAHLNASMAVLCQEMASAVVLVIIFIVSVTASMEDRTSLHISCDTENSYSLNSSFHNNLKQVLETLADMSATTGRFSKASAGDSPDQVFGQALCRGDVDGRDCQSCVRLAGQEILQNCSKTDADIWYFLLSSVLICEIRRSRNFLWCLLHNFTTFCLPQIREFPFSFIFCAIWLEERTCRLIEKIWKSFSSKFTVCLCPVKKHNMVEPCNLENFQNQTGHFLVY